jgi:hypothetical protein
MLPSGRKVLALDLLVALWACAWILVGVAVAEAIGGLTELTGAFRSVGGAVAGVGDTLGGVDVPLVGEPLDRAAGAVRDAGRDIVARGEATRDEIERAAVLLGAVVALIPILTVLLPYAPARLARGTEASALRRLVRHGGAGDDPALESFLAARALNTVAYTRLGRISERPWDLEAPATRRALAEEELRRLGVSPRRLGDGRRGRLGGPGEPPP